MYNLSIVEFTTNNHVNISTKMILFFANYGFYFRTSIEPSKVYEGAEKKAKLLAANKIIARQEEMLKFLKNKLAWAQDKQMRYAN